MRYSKLDLDPVALGLRIKTLRLGLGVSNYSQLAKSAGVSKGLWSELEQGKGGERVALRSYEKVAHALGLSLAELLNPSKETAPEPAVWDRLISTLERAEDKLDRALGQDSMGELGNASPRIPRMLTLQSTADPALDSQFVRLYGKAAAGLGEYSEPQTDEPPELIPITAAIAALPGRKIALRVVGDSMAPYLRDNDLVIVWYGEQHQIRERAIQGDIMVVTDGGNDEYVKSVYWDDETEKLTMTSLNPDFPGKRLSYENIKWTGLVVAWIKG